MAQFRTDAEIIALTQQKLSTISDGRGNVLKPLIKVVGLEVSDPRFLETIYRHDPPSRRLACARKQSSCGYVREYGLEEAGLDDPRMKLGGDVRGARAGQPGVFHPVVLEQIIAREKGALRMPDPSRKFDLPVEGDGVIIGCKGGRGVWGKGGLSEEHILTVAAVQKQISGDAYEIDSIDGGQPGIKTRTRQLIWCGPNNGELWAANLNADGSFTFDAADMRPTVGRRVFCWIDTDAILA